MTKCTEVVLSEHTQHHTISSAPQRFFKSVLKHTAQTEEILVAQSCVPWANQDALVLLCDKARHGTSLLYQW
jgi:hypothetical protein